jgi:hypothetical protein
MRTERIAVYPAAKKYFDSKELTNDIRPDGLILVHNGIQHTTRTRQGTSGFRAWLARPLKEYVVCDCGWRPEFGKHYRVG